MVKRSSVNLNSLRLSQRDLTFLVNTVSPGVRDKARLRQIIRDDVDFRNKYVSDEKVFCAVIEDEEALVKISPNLYFEILLRKAKKPLNFIAEHYLQYKRQMLFSN